MKKTIFLVFALVFGISSIGLLLFSLRGSSPSRFVGLEPITPILDFGDVEQAHISGSLDVVNRSQKRVKIVAIGKSCRCTEVVALKKVVSPGEKATITCQWNTEGMRGQAKSDFTVFYSIDSDSEPGMYSCTIQVQGNVIPQYDIIPDRLEFIEGKAETKTIRLVPRKKDQIIVKLVNCNSPAFFVEKNSDQTIRVTFVSDEWVFDQFLKPKVILDTSCLSEEYFILPIYVKAGYD
ncbi:MAG: DUF1573 domain-containing protein [Planctomycetaceae bacterium]|nr:DUF1573 domain-containing protein [Planctomycetaceae bacterium]